MSGLALRLPSAPARVYRAWVAYWREVEDRMLENPSVAEVAAEESAPFLRDPVADHLSAVLVPQVLHQAREAGFAMVAPLVEMDEAMARRGIEYMARRARWLGQQGIHDALGLQPPGEEVEDLLVRVLLSIRLQLERAPRRG